MSERQYNLAVCRFPGNCSEHPHSSSWAAKVQLAATKDPRISKVIPLWASDTPIPMVRNAMVKVALMELGADYILMIDSDMKPDCEPDGKPFWDVAWEFMMERRDREEAYRAQMDQSHPNWNEEKTRELFPPATIAAPYCGPPPFESVYVMKWASHGTGDPVAPRPLELKTYDRDHAAEFSGTFEVAALATGLILYDARVFKHLPPPWFEYEWVDEYHDRKACTEDIYQTRNAHLCGMPQFCAWDCWAGHHKDKVIRKPRALRVNEYSDALVEQIKKRHVGHGMESKVVVIGQEPDKDRLLETFLNSRDGLKSPINPEGIALDTI